MTKHNAANERIKRDYFRLLREARGYDESSIDAVAQAVGRFEMYTKHCAFDRFHIEQAIGFKRWLVEQPNQRTGKPLSKATLKSMMRALREFFLWLGSQPGYRSRISFGDTEYFRMSEKDNRSTEDVQELPVPSLEQIEQVLNRMPAATPIERRDRAVVAFTILTGARDNATASLRMKHVNLVERMVFQDPRAVRTKASKAIRTWFFPIGGPAEEIVSQWIVELRDEQLWAADDPLFPSTAMGLDKNCQFAPIGLNRQTWSTADPIRQIFRRAFQASGMPYFNPHSFRKTLARLGEQVCRTPEEFKAWSQNLGHDQVATTLSSYGSVPAHRQGALILGLRDQDAGPADHLATLLEQAGWQRKGVA